MKVDAFGSVPVERVTTRLIQTWKSQLGKLIKDGYYKPSTINGWLAQLRELMSIAVVEHDLKKNPMATVKDFDMSEHRPYGESADSLEPSQTRAFLAKLLELYPQHYAMAYLGFMTGGRVSIMITLRRSGPDGDIDWETGRLLNRRSKGHGPEVRNVVKQKDNFGVPLQDIVESLSALGGSDFDGDQVSAGEPESASAPELALAGGRVAASASVAVTNRVTTERVATLSTQNESLVRDNAALAKYRPLVDAERALQRTPQE